MADITYLEAGRLALAEEMDRDPLVWALGEDLGRGGVFKQYDGLQARFGANRIVDTPISEATIMGAAVGAAMNGTRPVVEMRFSDFARHATHRVRDFIRALANRLHRRLRLFDAAQRLLQRLTLPDHFVPDQSLHRPCAIGE